MNLPKIKTEKEKMMAGEPYNCGDPELIARWHVARRLTLEYNQTDSRDSEKIAGILKELLGSHGKKLWIAPPFFCDYGENIHIGENCEINFNCVFLDCNTITIGKNALFGPHVQIYAVTHPVRAEERLSKADGDEFAFCKGITAPVTIGDNVWIGGSSIIMPGITIGNNVTIGAGSIVTKSIPDNCLAFGNPCKVVKSF